MRIILNAPTFFANTYRGYLEYILFTALAKEIPDAQFLLPAEANSSTKPVPDNIKITEILPQKGLFLHKKQEKWLQSQNAQVYISFEKTLNTEMAIIQIRLFASEDDIRNAKNVARAASTGFTTPYLKEIFEQQYPAYSTKTFLVEDIIIDEVFEEDPNSLESIKEELTGGREYFITADFTLSKDAFVVLLKAFSGFKRMQQSNWKLVVVLRCDESINIETAEKLLSNYKYRADVVLTNAAHLNEKMAAAYTVVCLTEQEIFPVNIVEALRVSTPVIAPSTKTIKNKYGDNILYPTDNSSEALGNMLMTIYKSETYRQSLAKKIGSLQMDHLLREAVTHLKETIMQYRQQV